MDHRHVFNRIRPNQTRVQPLSIIQDNGNTISVCDHMVGRGDIAFCGVNDDAGAHGLKFTLFRLWTFRQAKEATEEGICEQRHFFLGPQSLRGDAHDAREYLLDHRSKRGYAVLRIRNGYAADSGAGVQEQHGEQHRNAVQCFQLPAYRLRKHKPYSHRNRHADGACLSGGSPAITGTCDVPDRPLADRPPTRFREHLVADEDAVNSLNPSTQRMAFLFMLSLP